tara:strand:- start:747 stop:3194 length:2448 start_codon:yes stop_codon:yes gene_type:complete
MAKFKNIIGTGFPKYVTDQIKTRTELVNKDIRLYEVTTKEGKKIKTSSDLLWLSNRVGWFRMTSGALIDGKDDLAKKNILQGSIQSKRGGFDSSYIRGPLGFKPTPGITSLSVGTGGRWQTLLEGEVEFIAYDLDQLETLSKLYMSLGVHVFIEWGHKPYKLSTSTTPETAIDINPINFFSKEYENTFKGAVTLQQRVNAKKKTLEGNYEALVGRVYNFDYNANPDGSYNCKIKVMGAGAMVDSLRMNSKYGKNSDPTEDDTPNSNPSDLANALVSIKNSLKDILKPKRTESLLGGSLGAGELLYIENFNDPGESSNKLNTYTNTLNSIYGMSNYFTFAFGDKGVSHQETFSKFGNAHQLINQINGEDKDSLKVLTNSFYTGYVSSLKYEETGWWFLSTSTPATYITLGHLFCLCQHLGVFVDTNSNTPSIYLDYHPDNTLIKTGPIEASVDPSICLIPFNDSPRVGIDSSGGNNTSSSNLLYPLDTKKTTTYKFQKGNKKNIDRYFPKNNEIDQTSKSIQSKFTGPDFGSGKLFNILVNIDFAYNTLISIQESKKDKEVMLRDYLEKILSGINIALGKNNSFKIVTDQSGMILRVIDENYVPKIDKKEGYITLPSFGKKSIAYDYSYSSKISKNLSAQIVIASQSQGKNIKDFSEDALTYFELNGEVSDKFTGIIKPPVKDTVLPTEVTEKELKNLQNLYDQFYKSYAIDSKDPIGKGVGASLNNLYSDLQQKFKNRNCGEGKTFTGGILIPLEMSITIDGISGILPYNAFLLPDNRLPKRYRGKVAFIVFSINHTFDKNQWKTTLRGQTIMKP